MRQKAMTRVRPGRLQLVQLPSILTVFAPSDNPIRPVQSDSVIVDNDSMVAKIYAGEGTPVLSALDGTVKPFHLTKPSAAA